MIRTIQIPSKKKTLTVIIVMALFLLLTAACIRLRSKHLLTATLYLVLFLAGLSTWELAVALLPFAVFRIPYDWMRTCLNYEVNLIDAARPYNLEKPLFGVVDNGVLVIPCEYFAVHHRAVADVFAGIFYLCWVPVSIPFGPCLYSKKKRRTYLRFALVSLFVSLIDFASYYTHPAAPPWYAINYGSKPTLNIPDSIAGLGRFDEIFGVIIFDSIYGRNANVFTAVPSLHMAYMAVALAYAIIDKCRWYMTALFSVVMAGIWGIAIYSYHHYIIGVFFGISCALLGWLLFEYRLMKIRGFRNFFSRYYQYIK